MKAPASILLWIPVAAVKVALAFVGFVIVPLFMALNWKLPKVYRGTPGRPHTIWELTFRNMVDGWKWYFDQPMAHLSGGSHPVYLESFALHVQGRRFGWQWRRSGLRSMFRCMWIYPGGVHYGEFFIGWKIGYQEIRKELDFALQLRPWADVGN